ncbi:MAG: DmsC/YnfH family molybdoenzyme membrane anchor subunit [Pseudomonadota bacterium]
MHPSRDIIFFTTASGAGYGILFWLGIFAMMRALPTDRAFGVVALVVAFGLIVAGLLASTRHLGHPERMLMAFSQWRSSWLSREGVLAMVTFGPAGLFALGWVVFENNRGLWADMGTLTAILAVATVFSTAMIYASLRAIPAWHSVWVPVNYLVLAGLTGAVFLNFVGVLFDTHQLMIARAAMPTILIALVCKLIYWAIVDSKRVSTIGSATQLERIGAVRPLDPPHTTSNYLQREMGYKLDNKVGRALRFFVVIWTYLVPFFCVLVGRDVGSPAWALTLALVALVGVAAGVGAERWLFFAEAKHQSALYYDERHI